MVYVASPSGFIKNNSYACFSMISVYTGIYSSWRKNEGRISISNVGIKLVKYKGKTWSSLCLLLGSRLLLLLLSHSNAMDTEKLEVLNQVLELLNYHILPTNLCYAFFGNGFQNQRLLMPKAGWKGGGDFMLGFFSPWRVKPPQTKFKHSQGKWFYCLKKCLNFTCIKSSLVQMKCIKCFVLNFMPNRQLI